MSTPNVARSPMNMLVRTSDGSSRQAEPVAFAAETEFQALVEGGDLNTVAAAGATSAAQGFSPPDVW
jgi:hypothetical protein